MPDDLTDTIAREAARLVADGRCAEVREAISCVLERPEYDGAHRPGEGRVRQHLQAMTMQTLGADGYAAAHRRWLEIAEETMTAIEEAFLRSETVLVGRVAAGHTDGDTSLHIRVYTDVPMKEIAELLVSFGYVDPAFETIDTIYGRLNRLRFDEPEAVIHLARCAPERRGAAGTNLFTGKPITAMSLKELRGQLAASD